MKKNAYNEVYDSYPEEDLVKIAENGDYGTLLKDYLGYHGDDLKEGETVKVEDLIDAMMKGEIRWCEKDSGIYYINDWAG